MRSLACTAFNLADLAYRYVETQDQGADVGFRPWVWIAMIFLGPVVGMTAVALAMDKS
jgi:hypothetical protein